MCEWLVGMVAILDRLDPFFRVERINAMTLAACWSA
jgi:hypothetical protein